MTSKPIISIDQIADLETGVAKHNGYKWVVVKHYKLMHTNNDDTGSMGAVTASKISNSVIVTGGHNVMKG